MRSYLRLFVSSVVFGSVPLLGDDPKILFQDTFEDLTQWGAPSNQLEGVRVIESTDENSEAFFGEAGNPYLRIFKGTNESVNNAMTGNGIISEPSPVITIAFDFWNSPDIGPGVVVMRPGRGSASNANRTHEIRWGRGQLAGVNGLYEAGQTYRMEVILNNSTETVAYNGFYTVAPDRFDVWLDGVRVLNDHSYSRPDPEVSTNMQVGDPYESVQFAVFTANMAEILIDNFVIYEGARATPASDVPGAVFYEPFDNLDAWGDPTNQSAGIREIGVTDANSETFFGEAGNSYLRFFKDDPEEDTVSMFIAAANVVSSPLVTVHFDFWENSAVGTETSGFSFRAGQGTSVPNAARIHNFTLRKGTLNEIEELYETDRLNNLQIVYNNPPEPVTYLGGAEVVESDSMDVWLNGRLVLKNQQYQRGDLAVGETIRSFQFVAFSNDLGELLVDDFTVYDTAFVIPSSDVDLPLVEILTFGVDGDDFNLTFNSETGFVYTVQFTTDLGTGWEDVATFDGTGDEISASRAVSGADRGFFRVAVSPSN